MAFRRHLDEGCESRAHEMATGLVAELVTLVADRPDTVVEDELCRRLGPLLYEARQGHPDQRVQPSRLAPALVEAAAIAVEETTGNADAWRVFTAVAGVMPYSGSDATFDAMTQLQAAMGKPVSQPTDPEVAGEVLWTRDAYGGRFGVAAPITAADLPVRWYLWDIDACGLQAFTVHSGFYPTPEAALAAWQDGVGESAAAGTEFAPVDAPSLLAELLPFEMGFLYVGGESTEQLAEYYRSKRLAEIVKMAVRQRETLASPGLDVATATTEFTAWLSARRNAAGQELPADVAELVPELADSWCINNIQAVFAVCSPHRVAWCAQHIRNCYEHKFAERLIALLPEWIRWLAARNETPPELADRCLPYAQDEPYEQLGDGPNGPDWLTRVIE
ncbi:hypothetical protein [Saccharopolyspora hattusasensis]|uniref:hypothetical protein n=1 Tax=Saccharopolyspora hattusasensis TaxID=1128679 RepID=UPI003D984C8C